MSVHGRGRAHSPNQPTHPPTLHLGHAQKTQGHKVSMRSLRSFLLVGAAALLGLSCAPGAAAMKDTIKNRIKLAEKYLEENPVEESVEAVAR